ncbi:MAG: VOC family protein [Nocardioidaceae bacterium]
MSRMMFVNLAVEDLQRSVDFFTGLGFKFNPQFTDENATCMVIGDEGYVMLLVKDYFATFTKKDICDTSSQVETLIGLSAESREEVDTMADKALASGGQPANEAQDHGFMYSRSFLDPDGHTWEILWMDPSALEQS